MDIIRNANAQISFSGNKIPLKRAEKEEQEAFDKKQELLAFMGAVSNYGKSQININKGTKLSFKGEDLEVEELFNEFKYIASLTDEESRSQKKKELTKELKEDPEKIETFVKMCKIKSKEEIIRLESEKKKQGGLCKQEQENLDALKELKQKADILGDKINNSRITWSFI